MTGGSWQVEAFVYMDGQKIGELKKKVTINAEEQLEEAEKQMRQYLFEKYAKKYDEHQLAKLKIEVTYEIAKSVGP